MRNSLSLLRRKPGCLALLALAVALIIAQLALLLWYLGAMDVWRFSSAGIYSSPWAQCHSRNFCSLESCFDFARCPPDPSQFRVHIYGDAADSPADRIGASRDDTRDLHRAILAAVRRSGFWTPNAAEACLLVPDFDTLCHGRCGFVDNPYTRMRRGHTGPAGQLQLSHLLESLPHWPADANRSVGAGSNHVLFELHDDEAIGMVRGNAILIKSGLSVQTFRPDFDVAIPLPGRKLFDAAVRALPPAQRQTLAFFKGAYTSRLRRVMNNALHRPPNFVSVHYKNKEWDYDHLNATVFGLVPRGNGLASYRLLEVMSAGCIPVIIADGYVLPFQDELEWSGFSVRVPESRVLQLPRILSAISAQERARMHRLVLQVYESHFASVDVIVRRALEAVKRRVYRRAF